MILVTGATGLVGSHLLVELTKRDQKVKALFRDKNSIKKTENVFKYKNALSSFDNIEWVQADILDIPALELAFKDVKYVYHCAAFISFDPKEEEKLQKVNIEGTANIVNLCLHFNIKKLCHVSSVAALGDTKENDVLIDEETPWNTEKNHGDYAISKYGAETEVWRGHHEGLAVVMVNPGVIFGYGFPDKGSSLLIQSVKNGALFYTKGKLGIVAVEDVVACMIQLLEDTTINGEQFTLVSENISVEKLFIQLAKNLGKKEPKYYANKVLTTFGCLLDWLSSKILGTERKLTKTTANAAHSLDIYSNTKIKKQLLFEFTPMEIYLKNLCKLY